MANTERQRGGGARNDPRAEIQNHRLGRCLLVLLGLYRIASDGLFH
jgi:hypothetical protein